MPDEPKPEQETKPLLGESVHAFLKRIGQMPREGRTRFIDVNGLGPMTVHSTGPADPPKDNPKS